MATCFGLSYLKTSSGQQVTKFRYIKCAPVVTYWPEDGLR